MAARTFLAWQPSPATETPKPRASASIEVIDLSDDYTGTPSKGRGDAIARSAARKAACCVGQRKFSASPRRVSDAASSPARSIPSLTSRSDSRAASASFSPSPPPQALALTSEQGQYQTSVQLSCPAHLATGGAPDPPDGHSGHTEDGFADIDSVLPAMAGSEARGRGAGMADGGTVEDQNRNRAKVTGSQGLFKPIAHPASALADSDSDTDSSSSSDASQCGKWSDRKWPIRRICGVRTRRGKKLYLVRWADTEEPEEALCNARQLIAEFEHRRRARVSVQATSCAPTYSGV